MTRRIAVLDAPEPTAAANLMTNPALDPFGKIPEFKYCAVAVQAGGTLPTSAGYTVGR